MQGDDIKRISRLTAILTLLQTKGRLTATSLSEKFEPHNMTLQEYFDQYH
jgi:predicted DNA-binding transcriptional regulator YafY